MTQTGWAGLVLVRKQGSNATRQCFTTENTPLYSVREFSQKRSYNRIMVHRRTCRSMKNCLLLVNYRLPVSSNSPPRSDLATGLFALILRKALWSPRASANASPRMEGSRRNNMLLPRRCPIANSWLIAVFEPSRGNREDVSH